jgi:hypothetical protein
MRWLGSMCTRAAASQGEARQAGYRGECAAAARAGTRTAVQPTANQMRVSEILEQLAVAADWRGRGRPGRGGRDVRETRQHELFAGGLFQGARFTALNLAERKDAILLVLICTGRDHRCDHATNYSRMVQICKRPKCHPEGKARRA